jgi:hypothetical protein
VPCYNLPKLHRLIRDEMPRCPNGLYETWTHISGILEKQKTDPNYKYIAELPPRPAPISKAAASERHAQAEATPVLS